MQEIPSFLCMPNMLHHSIIIICSFIEVEKIDVVVLAGKTQAGSALPLVNIKPCYSRATIYLIAKLFIYSILT